MKRHLIVFYTAVVVLLLAGRVAWQTCEWEVLSSVSATAVILSTLILGWQILRFKPESPNEFRLSAEVLASARIAILVLCAGMLFAGFGDVLGRWAFGCR